MHLDLAARRFVALVFLAALVAACAPPASPTVAPVAASASSSASSPVDPVANPPTAMLRVEGGDPVAGDLGSFQWHDVGSASPWLPGEPITVGAGEVATMTLDPALPITSWRARAAADPDGAGANGLSNGGQTVNFGVPGPGEWSIEVTVQFAEGVGSASYYWRMTVE